MIKNYLNYFKNKLIKKKKKYIYKIFLRFKKKIKNNKYSKIYKIFEK
ncbi:MAG: hypothetical protein NHG07_00125 [Candidatus Shikimatogenerans bostrichidophilus]|nr:MAG: hypothetical protein NHG07_00125 [Candidatus Shikimatogenerans bostrichidophilus]